MYSSLNDTGFGCRHVTTFPSAFLQKDHALHLAWLKTQNHNEEHNYRAVKRPSLIKEFEDSVWKLHL